MYKLRVIHKLSTKREANNLDYVSSEIRSKVTTILEDPSISFFTKEIINKGLNKDVVDAYHSTKLATDILEQVMKDVTRN